MEELTDIQFEYLGFQYCEYFEQMISEDKEISEHYCSCRERSDYIEFIAGHLPLLDDFSGLVWFFINYIQELEEKDYEE